MNSENFSNSFLSIAPVDCKVLMAFLPEVLETRNDKSWVSFAVGVASTNSILFSLLDVWELFLTSYYEASWVMTSSPRLSSFDFLSICPEGNWADWSSSAL